MTSATRSCPICKKPRSTEHTPFCSARCKDRDLQRWFSDGYSVPGEPVDPESIVRPEEAGEESD